MFDCIVIGASAAGLFAAEILAKHGKKVALFEREEKIDPRSRTYIITSGIFRVIPDLDQDLIRQQIDSIRVQSDQVSADILFSSPDLVIDRRDLILELAGRAINAGVEVIPGSEFIGFDLVDDRTEVIFRRGKDHQRYQTRAIIAAHGVQSQVREAVFNERLSSTSLLQAVIKRDENQENLTETWFDVEGTPYFFWLIPDRNASAVVGLISDSKADIRGLLDKFLEARGYAPVAYQSGNAAEFNRKLRNETLIGQTQLLFVGDAAGHVKVTTVGGAVTGLRGAKAAVESIIEGTSYQLKLRKLNRELSLHFFIRRLLNRMTDRDYQYLIRLISSTVEKFLGTYDRDGMRQHFWKLPILQPGFIPLGLKLLIKDMFSGLRNNR